MSFIREKKRCAKNKDKILRQLMISLLLTDKLLYLFLVVLKASSLVIEFLLLPLLLKVATLILDFTNITSIIV